MKAVFEEKEGSKAELKVTVDGEVWADAQTNARKKIAKDVTAPGFRKGHVPASMLDRLVSDKEVMMKAAEDVAQKALEYGLDENKDVRLVDRPELDIDAITKTEVTLKFILTVYPKVTLNDYKSVEYKVDKVSVSKKEVDEEIAKLQQKSAEEVLKEEGTVEKGNIAVIDFEGFVDGVAFDGGKGNEYALEIGSDSFIPGFEDQIIGMTTGEEKDINVTFPKDYAADLAGKDATFKVKVDAIKEKIVPELTDDLVKEMKINEQVNTVDELVKFIKNEMKLQKTSKAEEEATNNLLTGLCEKCEVNIPEAMINQEIEETFENYKQRISQQGIDMNMYYQITGSNEAMFKESLKEEAEKKVRVRIILEAIGKDLDINPTDEEIEEQYQSMATQYKMEVEKIKEIIPQSYLFDDIRMSKTLETLKGIKA